MYSLGIDPGFLQGGFKMLDRGIPAPKTKRKKYFPMDILNSN